MKNFSKLLKKYFPKIQFKVPLKNYTSFNIGGPADFLLIVETREELVKISKIAFQHNIPFKILGRGTNVLCDSKGFKGLIVINNFSKIALQSNSSVFVGSGTDIFSFIDFTIENSISTFYFLAGIPGTMGGALVSNAGAFGNAIGNYLINATVVSPEKGIICVDKNYFNFNYRYSNLKKGKDILIEFELKFEYGNKQTIKHKIESILQLRKEKHPPENTYCAGSYFKNIPQKNKFIAAGKLLEKAGAKSLKVGDAAVFEKHANFIINLKNASSNDVLKLAEMMKAAVKSKFNYTLEEEVVYIPSTY